MMMKLADESAISTEELGRALESGALQILLIDCRSFMEFNSCHIIEAHNIHCPPIVKRRSGGILPLANIVRCPQTRCRLLAGGFDMVVVYEGTTAYTEVRQESNLSLVLKTLRDEIKIPNVYHLQGGFESFHSSIPHRCWDAESYTESLTTPSPESVMCIECGVQRGTKRCSCNMLQLERFKVDQSDPVEVLPWLFVGSALHACQTSRLKALGVSALLNVSLSEFPQMEGMLYKNIPIHDNSTTDILTWFPEAIDFIENVRKSHGCVLVHCHAGISRSATICLAYLMYHQGYTLNQAYDYLKSRRSIISPNFNFMRQLKEYELALASHREHDIQREATPKSAQKTPLKLTLSPLTPMGRNQKAGVFMFDTPVLTPLAGPPISPLLSPS